MSTLTRIFIIQHEWYESPKNSLGADWGLGKSDDVGVMSLAYAELISGGGRMEDFYEYEDGLTREKELEKILVSSLDPVTKVRRIISLGVGEEDANEIVERYQIGQMAPVYYERLDFDDTEEDLLQEET